MTRAQSKMTRLACLAVTTLLAAGDALAATAGHAPDPAHGAAGSHGGGGGLPQFDPTWFASQIFWLSVAFLVLYLWFSRKTLPEISGVLENRREHVQGDLDTADRLTREAEHVQQAYESGLDKAREEAARIISDVEETMKAKAAQSLGSLKERADREIATTESRIAMAKAEAMGQINVIAADVAAEAAAKIVGMSVTHQEALQVVERLSLGEEPKAA